MELWDRLLAVVRMLRPRPERHYFELDAPLQAALEERASREQRPLQQFGLELLTAGLADLQTADELKRCWDGLSGRQREVAALTCLGYTNRQMAARLGVAPDTVKSYIRQVLFKFHTHSKQELRISLADWDFSAWGKPAQE